MTLKGKKKGSLKDEKLKKIKDELNDEDVKEMKEIFNYVNDNYYLVFKEDKDRPTIKNGRKVRFLREFTPQEKKVYMYRQLPVDYYNKTMTWCLFEQLYDENKINIELNNTIKKLDTEISILQNTIKRLEEIKEIKDIEKIIQERDYYKKKWNDYEFYNIK